MISTQNPYITILKERQPEVYKKRFIDQDGHLGYETITENEENFVKQGFKLIKHLGIEKWYLLHQSVYSKMANVGGRAGATPSFGSNCSRSLI
jgi:hypothetical protein